eukprot:gnl/Dysnectes_brevis/8326_a14700_131.p1 GENE.gnl/Dysnectes_brevis/8326_a14700_131~~gnl/Dysnectes_brevis/8326_a14700_131.p1  ORF type:complete len:614 (+),score=185.47 gnl/Dysnectes_brevis/8326_a14700_131:123-1844(+)
MTEPLKPSPTVARFSPHGSFEADERSAHDSRLASLRERLEQEVSQERGRLDQERRRQLERMREEHAQSLERARKELDDTLARRKRALDEEDEESRVRTARRKEEIEQLVSSSERALAEQQRVQESSLAARRSELNASRDRITTDLAALETELRHSRETLASRQRSISELQKSLDDAERSIEDRRRGVRAAEETLSALRPPSVDLSPKHNPQATRHAPKARDIQPPSVTIPQSSPVLVPVEDRADSASHSAETVDLFSGGDTSSVLRKLLPPIRSRLSQELSRLQSAQAVVSGQSRQYGLRVHALKAARQHYAAELAAAESESQSRRSEKRSQARKRLKALSKLRKELDANADTLNKQIRQHRKSKHWLKERQQALNAITSALVKGGAAAPSVDDSYVPLPDVTALLSPLVQFSPLTPLDTPAGELDIPRSGDDGPRPGLMLDLCLAKAGETPSCIRHLWSPASSSRSAHSVSSPPASVYPGSSPSGHARSRRYKAARRRSHDRRKAVPTPPRDRPPVVYVLDPGSGRIASDASLHSGVASEMSQMLLNRRRAQEIVGTHSKWLQHFKESLDTQ